jgi:hypothetical protein
MGKYMNLLLITCLIGLTIFLLACKSKPPTANSKPEVGHPLDQISLASPVPVKGSTNLTKSDSDILRLDPKLVERRSTSVTIKNERRKTRSLIPLQPQEKKLDEGKILVNFDNPMHVGKWQDLTVRIENLEIANFKKDLFGNTTVENNLAIADKIKLIVDQTGKIKFDISSSSPQTQAFINDSYVEWNFKIKPLQIGLGTLVFIPVLVNGVDESQVGTKRVFINVKVSSGWFSAKREVFFNWLGTNAIALKMIGAALAGLSAAIWAVYTFKKK